MPVVSRQRLKYWGTSSVRARTQPWVIGGGGKVQRTSGWPVRAGQSASKPFDIVPERPAEPALSHARHRSCVRSAANQPRTRHCAESLCSPLSTQEPVQDHVRRPYGDEGEQRKDQPIALRESTHRQPPYFGWQPACVVRTSPSSAAEIPQRRSQRRGSDGGKDRRIGQRH